MPVSDGIKESVFDALRNNDFVKQSPELETLANKLINRIGNVDNVHDLRIQRTLIGSEMDAAARAGGPELNVLKTAYDALTKAREGAIEESNLPDSTKGTIKDLDTQYASLKGLMKQMGVESGLGAP